MIILTFRRGMTDGIPIALGYLSVSFAFGMIAYGHGLPLWASSLISATCITGTGQFVGVGLMAAGAGLLELICTIAVINARYFLMSMSLQQRLPSDMTLPQKLIIAHGNTDEIFAVSMMKTEPLNFRYMCGIILCSWLGWVGGTVLGSAAGAIFPAILLDALGIALYAMYAALVIPEAKRSRTVLLVTLMAAAVSCLFTFMPALSSVGGGWVIIIAGLSASALGALLFPVDDSTGETETGG
ncbi:MAG: AzlC family ABC transporter permease [Clostridiales bacterium]|nr:AzlC family ABC transporter permease [Clostridiales bacterium]